MIMKRILFILGLFAVVQGYYNLFHPPVLITDVNQSPELVQKAMDVTLVNMGMVLGGGLMLLLSLFLRR